MIEQPLNQKPPRGCSLQQRIIFENSQIVVIDKPSGWLSVPSRIGAADPRPCVGLALQEERQERLWPVHRLDFEVSGLLVMAKDAKTHQILNNLFEKREVEKTYHGVTLIPGLGGQSHDPSSIPGQQTQGAQEEWRSQLVRGKKRTFEASHGKPSVTFARCLGEVSFSKLDSPTSSEHRSSETFRGFHWELKPHTGRPHQLRYELAKRGFAIWGDQLYGGANLFRSKDFIALRCINLKFGTRLSALGDSFPDSFSTGLSLLSLVREALL